MGMRRGVIGRCEGIKASGWWLVAGERLTVRDRGAPDGAVAGGWWLVPSYKLLATSYLHTRRPLSSGVGQPTIGRPFYVQAKGQLRLTWRPSAGSPQSEGSR